MPRRRPVSVGVLACLIATPVVLGAPALADPASATPTRAAPAAVLKASVPDVMPGERITLTAGAPRVRGFKKLRAKDRRRARLVLQRRVDSTWRKVAVRRLRTKQVTYPFRALSGASGTLRFRTVAKLRGRTYRGGRLQLPVVAPRLASTPSGLATATAVAFTSSVTPARPGRALTLQVHEGGAWKPVGSLPSDAAGSATLAVDAPAHPVWYRVVADGWNGTSALVTEPVRTVLGKVPSVIAHRAGAGAAPEQTLAAVRQALAEGVPSMEIDVQLTQDRVPVIIHDQSLARTTDVETRFPGRPTWNVADFTLAEIKTLDAGSWFGAQFAGERIPTLDEVLEAIKDRSHLVLEVKEPGLAGNEQVDEVLGEQLASGLLGEQAADGALTVSSFDVGWLQAFGTAHPDVPVGVLTTLSPTIAQLDAWRGWAEEIHPNFVLVSRAAVDAARARGMSSSVWTVNSVAAFQRALALGAERIITDHPRMLASVVAPPRPTS